MTTRMPTAERKAQIVDAAIKIIGEKGLREFTAAQIGREVGIKDGSIFRHFKNKNEIVMAVLDRLEGVLNDTIPPPNDDPLKRLGEFFLARLEIVGSQPGVQSLLFSNQLSHAGGKAGLKRVMKLRKQGRDFIKSCLLEASEKKLIRHDLDLTDILVLFNGAVMGFLLIVQDKAIEEPIEKRAAHVWQTLISLIRR